LNQLKQQENSDHGCMRHHRARTGAAGTGRIRGGRVYRHRQ